MNKNILYAIDIIHPFSKTVKIDGLNELLNRLSINNYFDKVSEYYQKIHKQIIDNKISDIYLIINFLNDISKNKNLSEKIKFKLYIDNIYNFY